MKFLGYFVFTLSIFSFLGCTSIVEKPEVNKIKTAAIVSIYANSDVREAHGGGSVQGWSADLKQEVSAAFLDNYVDSMGNELGWNMVSSEKLLQSEEYQSMFRPTLNTKSETLNKIGGFMNKLADLSEKHSYFTPPDMHPIELNNGKMNTVSYHNGGRVDARKNLADMANKLNVDAVVVVQIDYCYEPASISFMGLSKAHMTAASTIYAVDKQGKMVVNMGQLKQCAKRKNRGKSTQGYGLIGGNLVVAFQEKDKLKKMFVEATQENTRLTMDQLKKAIH